MQSKSINTKNPLKVCKCSCIYSYTFVCVLTFAITFNGILWYGSNANANTITKRYGNQILSFANNMHCSKPAEIFEQNETAINIVSAGVNTLTHSHACMHVFVYCVLCV